MKKFEIAINSEKQYNKVKAYAEKWGYKPFKGITDKVEESKFIFFEKDNSFNPAIKIDSDVDIIADNWKKIIRENSPLTLENIYLEIDNTDKQLLLWDIIKDSGLKINTTTRIVMPDKEYIVKKGSNLHFDDNHKEFTRTGCNHNSKTLITPKQLAQMLGVKTDKQEVRVFIDESVDFEIGKDLKFKTSGKFIHESVVEKIQETNKRIDKLAKNYKIIDTDQLVTRKEFKELSSKLRKRIYDLETKLSETNNSDLKLPIADNTVNIPKIAIRVESEKESSELLDIFTILGFKWRSGHIPKEYKYWDQVNYPNYITFNNGFNRLSSDDSFNDYTIIPFSQIKGLK